ncbi:MAG: SEL1-like repeat protein [Rhodospirillales bacterium]|nr:SEL1-like repeat protein [Rhodospirillales bacterium]
MTPNPAIRVVKAAFATFAPLLAAAALWTSAAGPTPAADLLAEGAAAYEAGDYAEAAKIWRPLAEDGDALAQFNLGLLHETGRGVAEEPAEAAGWYERAARQGMVRAQYNLALLHQVGRGVAQDVAQALFWLEVAARLGEGVEQEQAAEAAAQLTPLLEEGKLEAAQARARAFTPRPEEAPIRSAAVTLILSERQVETLQRRLAAHGYDPGPADGIPGEQTHSAVRRYLADRGLAWPEGELLTQRLLDLVAEP